MQAINHNSTFKKHTVSKYLFLCQIFVVPNILICTILFTSVLISRSNKDKTRGGNCVPVDSNPCVQVDSSTFRDDWMKMVNCDELSDVIFILGLKKYHAHNHVLCCSSEVFRKLFGVEDCIEVKSERHWDSPKLNKKYQKY